MNAIDLFVSGIATVFLTLGVLAFITYLIGKLLGTAAGTKARPPVAAIVAKLRSEGRL